jgi:hypothetical protein
MRGVRGCALDQREPRRGLWAWWNDRGLVTAGGLMAAGGGVKLARGKRSARVLSRSE